MINIWHCIYNVFIIISFLLQSLSNILLFQNTVFNLWEFEAWIHCILLIFTLQLHPTPPVFTTHSHALPSHSFLEDHPHPFVHQVQFCCPYTHWYETKHWNLVNLTGTTLLIMKPNPYLRIAPDLGLGVNEALHLHAGMSTGLTLSNNYCWYDFKNVVLLLCPEDSFSLVFSKLCFLQPLYLISYDGGPWS